MSNIEDLANSGDKQQSQLPFNVRHPFLGGLYDLISFSNYPPDTPEYINRAPITQVMAVPSWNCPVMDEEAINARYEAYKNRPFKEKAREKFPVLAFFYDAVFNDNFP